MADYMNEDKPRPKGEVIIEDLRHRRNVDDVTDQEPEEAAEPEDETPVASQPLAAAAPADIVEEAAIPVYEEGARIDASDEAEHELSADIAEAQLGDAANSIDHGDYGELPPGVTEEDIRAAEREQMRQLLGLGVVNYLRYQLSMIYNFAVIGLGGVPDPSTGLVTKNLAQAKIAIDVFEYIVGKIEPEMQAAERAEMRQLIQQIKYAYIQAAAEDLPTAPGAPGVPGA